VLIRQQREAVIYLITFFRVNDQWLMKKGDMMPLQSTSPLSETKPFSVTLAHALSLIAGVLKTFVGQYTIQMFESACFLFF